MSMGESPVSSLSKSSSGQSNIASSPERSVHSVDNSSLCESPAYIYSPGSDNHDDSPYPVPVLARSHNPARVIRSKRRRKDSRDQVDELCSVNAQLTLEAEELESLLSKTQRDREKEQNLVRDLEGYTDELGVRLSKLEEELKARESEKREMHFPWILLSAVR
eukprot:GHVN01068313.1.p1 GENE.GHVN01068313.1~~GHVN01068313.1.p1  ORF type:complete len:163 (-),score=12.45 GHVN01068313.1:736-1224(-)